MKLNKMENTEILIFILYFFYKSLENSILNYLLIV